MGYNLQLYCRTCDERAYAWRGHESAAIADFATRHPGSGHEREVAIDNGFTEAEWADPTETEWTAAGRGGDLALPDLPE